MSNLTSKKWLADQIARLQHDLEEQKQKTTEAQSTLLKCESENKHLIAEIARISEENNAVLDEAAKKHAAEKETLQAEMELYQTQVSVCIDNNNLLGGMFYVFYLCFYSRG